MIRRNHRTLVKHRFHRDPTKWFRLDRGEHKNIKAVVHARDIGAVVKQMKSICNAELLDAFLKFLQVVCLIGEIASY